MDSETALDRAREALQPHTTDLRRATAGPVMVGRELLIAAAAERDPSERLTLITHAAEVFAYGVANPHRTEYPNSSDAFASADALMWEGISLALINDARTVDHLHRAAAAWTDLGEFTKAGRSTEEWAESLKAQLEPEADQVFDLAFTIFIEAGNPSRAAEARAAQHRVGPGPESSFLLRRPTPTASTTVLGSSTAAEIRRSLALHRQEQDEPAFDSPIRDAAKPTSAKRGRQRLGVLGRLRGAASGTPAPALAARPVPTASYRTHLLGAGDEWTLGTLAAGNARFGNGEDRPWVASLSAAEASEFVGDPRTICVVAIHNESNHIAGFAYGGVLYRRHSALRHLCIEEMGVDVDHRHQGVEDLLFAEIRTVARGRGIGWAFAFAPSTDRERGSFYDAVDGISSGGDELLYEFEF